MSLDFGAIPARIGRGLQKIFGSANERALKRYQPLVDTVNGLAAWAEGLDQDALRARMSEWREKVQAETATLDDALPEVFAMTREAAKRTIGLRHFDVQLIGGAVLHDGKIAEMATGEGKTLVATLPAVLNALSGKGVFVVTVNDYLAKRDRDWMANVYEYLGLTCGAIQSSMSPHERHSEYACDITYGTNNEFGFDYLRDNMKDDVEQQVQKTLNFAIIDEVDSILIDEARTPLLISGPPEGNAQNFLLSDRIVRQLREGEHFEIKLKEQQCLLTEAGIEKAEKLAGVKSFYADPQHMVWPHLIEQSLRAHHIYKRDKDYVVGVNQRSGEKEVVIVDEFTGRLMSGRRWSDGLHQAVEAKEGFVPQEESQTLATITLQNYFRMFKKLAGMTGTAMTEASEFAKVYELDVVAIPTNRPIARDDNDDLIYLRDEDKHRAIVEEITAEHERGRPILLGTTSIEKSERLSALLKESNVPHDVLNAKRHAFEADIVMQAGRKGAVTVATNMAGRGTDIVLGGNAERLWDKECKAGLDREGEAAKARLEELRTECRAERDEILGLGGLLVVGTERHESRRIDNQLRGRCGRQGDPGTTKYYLSFDDDLMKIFARDWVKTFMETVGLKGDERIESRMISRRIQKVQKQVESRNFDIRKNLLEYDEVMDRQRAFIYGQRQEVLLGEGLRDKVVGMFEEVLDPVVELHAGDSDKPVEYAEIRTWVDHKVGTDSGFDWDGFESVEREQLFDWLVERFEGAMSQRLEKLGEDDADLLMRKLLLRVVDEKWKDHLYAMEVLKSGIGLRGYAQVDPKNEYKKEGYDKFRLLKQAIADQVTNLFFRIELAAATQMDQQARRMALPRLPSDPQLAQAVIQSWIASGNAPPEIVEAFQRGAKITFRPGQDPIIEEDGNAAAPADGGEPKADGGTSAPAEPPAAEPAPVRDQASARTSPGAARPAVTPTKRPGRNDPCPCGSGVKYKKCCSPSFG